MAKMQKEKVNVDNEPMIDNLFPTFYGSGLVQGDLYLVFQVNLSWSLSLWSLFYQDIITGTGFRVTEKTEFHSIEQVNIFISFISCFYLLTFIEGEAEPLQLGKIPRPFTLLCS